MTKSDLVEPNQQKFLNAITKVRLAINNPNNKEMHRPLIKEMIRNLEIVYCFNSPLYDIGRCKMVMPLYDELYLKTYGK